ncbi:PIG-P-domain-containing protein [Stereum hirsutum FP-91666 SS1]|uniref:PIG-P-domain-containing protein n=1 Tax=Stereum hirsutum (strain FP-91666) TaxID=721885 RepID=UPI000440F0D4|nr:PIG-P-domain-containing protein [Stereum hirsutum FP-91666 SS1]EIM88843.1 PIG-P-domain-containing protein [Stereum hirsutum FP-91666 SS1]
MSSPSSADLPTSPIAPLAPFPPLPPAEYRSRAPEFYGFVAWTSTSIIFVVYLLWALLPDEVILWLGVDWYPNREWALLVPSWLCIVALLTYFTYFAMALRGTPSFNDLRTITGQQDISGRERGPQAYAKFASPGVIPEAYDIPIGILNDVLYGHRGASRQRPARSASNNKERSGPA